LSYLDTRAGHQALQVRDHCHNLVCTKGYQDLKVRERYHSLSFKLEVTVTSCCYLLVLLLLIVCTLVYVFRHHLAVGHEADQHYKAVLRYRYRYRYLYY
jgi:hypothetical protein